MRLIDKDALNSVIVQRHDFFRGCTAAPEKARRDELLQVMCDINEQPTIPAIPVEWLEQQRDKRRAAAAAHSRIGSMTVLEAINVVLDLWEKEQEAR